MITITEMAEVHAARIAERDGTIATLTAENERLRALVKTGYAEAFEDANEFYPAMTDFEECWLTSSTRAALQPEEGE